MIRWKHCTIKSVKGDHYASVMFRVAVEYKTQADNKASKSLIIKTMPELEDFKKEQLDESHIFQTGIVYRYTAEV